MGSKPFQRDQRGGTTRRSPRRCKEVEWVVRSTPERIALGVHDSLRLIRLRVENGALSSQDSDLIAVLFGRLQSRHKAGRCYATFHRHVILLRVRRASGSVKDSL